MNLNTVLAENSISPNDVLVMRHRPSERRLREILPWLAEERPELFNAYQSSQNPKEEKSLERAKYLASLVGHEPGKAVFVGLYSVGPCRPVSKKEYWEIPENQELRKRGMADWTIENDRLSYLWFDLDVTQICHGWKGKLILGWPGGERSWSRWADRNEFPILAILEESILVPRIPTWDKLVLTWDKLKIVPRSWRLVLSQWRGIYLIFDVSDSKAYVGSAYGTENLLSRWSNYGLSGHGGNKQMRGRDPENFRFSILQLVAQDMPADAVVALEATWKDRLHTREFGLNEN
jgi:GIY-YIG catalytic domain-containing protein